MEKTIDLELKRAFTELQQKMIETTTKLKFSDAQIEGLRRSKQHAEITEREISSLDSKTKTYESIGRVFLLKDISEVKANLTERQNVAKKNIKMLENNKQYLERNLKEAENNLRDMVQKKKSADVSS